MLRVQAQAQCNACMQRGLHSASPLAHNAEHRGNAHTLLVACSSPEVQAHGEVLVLQVQDEVGGKVLLAHLAGPEPGLCLLLTRHMLCETSSLWQAMPFQAFQGSMGCSRHGSMRINEQGVGRRAT